jgi:hypothetical protein
MPLFSSFPFLLSLEYTKRQKDARDYLTPFFFAVVVVVVVFVAAACVCRHSDGVSTLGRGVVVRAVCVGWWWWWWWWGGDRCLACPGGSFVGSVGASACSACPTGEYSSSGSANCSFCPFGTYQVTTSTDTDHRDSCASPDEAGSSASGTKPLQNTMSFLVFHWVL